MSFPQRGTSPHSPHSGNSSHSPQASEASVYGPREVSDKLVGTEKQERPIKKAADANTVCSSKRTPTRRNPRTSTASSLCSTEISRAHSTLPSMTHMPRPIPSVATHYKTPESPSSRMVHTRSPREDSTVARVFNHPCQRLRQKPGRTDRHLGQGFGVMLRERLSWSRALCSVSTTLSRVPFRTRFRRSTGNRRRVSQKNSRICVVSIHVEYW